MTTLVTIDANQEQGDTDGEPGLARRLNLWLSKFASAASAKSYADDLGMPHAWRAWDTASDPATPGRRGRRRSTFRRGTAFFDWCAARGLDPLATVGLEQLQQWLRDAEAAGLAKTTRAHMLTAVREFYRAMQQQGVPVGDPAALVDARAAELTGTREDDGQLHLDVAEVRQLLLLARRATRARRGAAYPQRDLAALLVLATTGARASEVTSLDLADYRRAHPSSGATLRLHGKGATIRTAQLDAASADELDRWLHQRSALLGQQHTLVPPGQSPGGAQPLFCTRSGARLAPSELGRIMRRLAAQDGSPLAGLADQLHPHALRAAFATSALDAGVPIEQVAAAMGHAHISTTLGYDRRRKRRNSRAFAAVAAQVTPETDPPADETRSTSQSSP